MFDFISNENQLQSSSGITEAEYIVEARDKMTKTVTLSMKGINCATELETTETLFLLPLNGEFHFSYRSTFTFTFVADESETSANNKTISCDTDSARIDHNTFITHRIQQITIQRKNQPIKSINEYRPD